MDINIKTKYNTGDIVYICKHYYDFCPISKPYIIKNILINGSVDKLQINYEIEQDALIECIPEHWIFSTYAECTKWCKKQNKIS